MTSPSPVPMAIPASVLPPPAGAKDVVTLGDLVQEQGSPQQNVNLSAGNNNLNPNTITVLYTVPVGKTLVITSCFISGNTSSTTNQFFTLRQGSADIAAAQLGATSSLEMCNNGVITVASGTALKAVVGSGTVGISVKASGYLVDPSSQGTPQQSQPAATPTLA